MDLETVWYESFPYLYGLGGLVLLLVSGSSNLLKVSGILLIVAAIVILRARRNYRRATFYELPFVEDAKPGEPMEPSV